MSKENDSYILYTNDVLSDDLCEKILKSALADENYNDSGVVLGEDFSNEIYPEMHSIISENIRKYIAEFKIDSFPDDWGLEPFHVRGFRSSEEKTQYQIDVGSYDMAKRFVALFWSLNETNTSIEFYHQDITITPEKSSLLMYPSLWTHPQLKTLPTEDSVEYILGTYLHYI